MHDGYLHDFHPADRERGLLSFYRLIGCVYFNTHAGAFSQNSPVELFNSVMTPGMSSLEQHIAFINAVRDGHFHRINDESLWMPSSDALRLHWLRCCWSALLWEQTTLPTVSLPSMQDHGWRFGSDGKLMVKWDTEENIAKINESIKFLKEGCKCKTGCVNLRCKCKKRESLCGPGCSCVGCQNNTEVCLQDNSTDGDEDSEASGSENADYDEESDGYYDDVDIEVDNYIDMNENRDETNSSDYDSDVDIYGDVDTIAFPEAALDGDIML